MSENIHSYANGASGDYKLIWTESDFEGMAWHDVEIRALAFQPNSSELILDIDYIFSWVDPNEDKFFRFWVSPATLVFEHVYDISIESDSYNGDLQISKIERLNPRTPRNSNYTGKETEWLWSLELSSGDIKFMSTGFKLFVRQKPTLSKSQMIELGARGGFSFSRQFENA